MTDITPSEPQPESASDSAVTDQGEASESYPVARPAARNAGVHHVCIQTNDAAEISWLLKDLLGMRQSAQLDVPPEAARHLLTWPEEVWEEAPLATLYGHGLGAIEVIELPQEVRDRTPAQWALVSFAVRDLGHAERLCREQGLKVGPRVRARVDDTDIVAVKVAVSGVAVELVQFFVSDPESDQDLSQ